MHRSALAAMIVLAATGGFFCPRIDGAIMPVDSGLVVWLQADAITGMNDGDLFSGPNNVWPDSAAGTIGDGVGQDATVVDGSPTYRTNQ
ncbi:MAG: hypothetical protein ACOCWL_04185, partial [Thermoguttaceae bacterium]